MTLVVGILAAAALLVLGALHVYWAGGGRWRTDVAIPTREGLPRFAPGIASTLTVAMLLFAAALVLLGRLRLWGEWLTVVAVYGGHMDARRSVRWTRRRRFSMVRAFQASDGNSIRVVGHLAFRPTLRAAIAGGAAGCGDRAVTRGREASEPNR
jgi:hypothetical protein